MSRRLIMVPGTLCDRRLFAAVARRLRPRVAVQVARWKDLLRGSAPPWWQGQGTVSLLGFSLGGIWALDRLQRSGMAPEQSIRIDRLALVGSNAEPAGRAHAKRAREQQRLLHRRGPAAVARAAKSRYFARRPQRWQARLVVDMARRTPIQIARAQIRLAARRSDGLEAFSRFPGPVAVLSGAKDRLCPPSLQQRLLSARTDAIAQSWSDCGHMIPLEAPGRLAQAILRWLSEPLAAPPASPGVSTR